MYSSRDRMTCQQIGIRNTIVNYNRKNIYKNKNRDDAVGGFRGGQVAF